MKLRHKMITLVLWVCFAVVGSAAVETEKLIQSIDKLKNYTYGNTQGVDLRRVEEQVGMASVDAKVRGAVEGKLIEALGAATTNDAKQFYCRQLRTVGTVKSVPVLAGLLTEPEMSHMARYALGRIDTPEAGEALRKALAKTSGIVKAGIINTLVKADYARALADILKLIDDPDKVVAVAAIKAAGHFPCNSSIHKLKEKRKTVSDDLKIEIDGALLTSAEIWQAKDDQRAEPIYREFYTGDYSGQLRVAGLRGLVMMRGSETADLLVEAIKGNDADLRRNAIGMMALIKGKKTTDTFVALADTLPSDGQELIVRALAARNDVSAASAVIKMVGSSHENVRLAALEALGTIGTPQAIAPLGRAAADGPNREKQIARSSLVRINGPGIEAALIKAVKNGDTDVREQVIAAVGQRPSRQPFDTLLDVAVNDGSSSLRREAIVSMGRIGEPSDLSTVLKLASTPKQNSDRAAVERAAIILFGKIEDTSYQANVVIAAYRKAPDEAKPVLLGLLRRPATPEALSVVTGAVDANDRKISDAAIRALGEWPHPAPAETLYEIASGDGNQIHKVLALRGYIRLALMLENPTAGFVKALKIAERPDDIKAVLSGMGHTDTLEALEIAESYMEKEEFKAEAMQAAVRIAAQYGWRDKERAQFTLKRINFLSENDSIRRQTVKAIEDMERLKDYVFVWKGTGPFTVKGVHDGRQVFDHVFPPEKNPDDPTIKWVRVTPRLEGNNRIDLQRTFGDLDYCCAYLVTKIISPKEQEVNIRLEVDDIITGRLNGKALRGQKATLNKGANRLMLKVGDHGGGWNFNCRITQPDGSVPEGLKFLPE